MIYPDFLTMIWNNNGLSIKAVCIDSVSRKRPSIRDEMQLPEAASEVEVSYFFNLWLN